MEQQTTKEDRIIAQLGGKIATLEVQLAQIQIENQDLANGFLALQEQNEHNESLLKSYRAMNESRKNNDKPVEVIEHDQDQSDRA